jgi:hypothetical protein
MTFEEVIQELSEWVDQKAPDEPPIRLDNWAAMADMTYRDFFERGRRNPYAPILKRYFAASRAWHEAIHDALREAGINDIVYIRGIAERFGALEKTVRNKAQRLGLPSSTRKQKISIRKCLAVAQLGMTLGELADAAGYKKHSLANLIPRDRFNGKISFDLRWTETPRGRRKRLVIVKLKRKK